MADVENLGSRFIGTAPFILTAAARSLAKWPSSEPKYKYLFAVNIIDTDWKNFKCEVRFMKTAVKKQADLIPDNFRDVMKNGKQASSSGLNILLNTDEPSLIIFNLDENGATFEHPDHLGDAKYVILRKSRQRHLIYQASWLTGITDQKMVSVILRGHKATDYPISYGLRVRTESGGSISYNDIDPKIENDGDGGKDG